VEPVTAQVFYHRTSYSSKIKFNIVFRNCFFRKHGPYNSTNTHCNLGQCNDNFMRCREIFVIPLSVMAAVYVPTYRKPRLVRGSYFVQHWTCNSKTFHPCVCCSSNGPTEDGLFYNTFDYILSLRDTYTHPVKAMQASPLGSTSNTSQTN